MSKRNSYAVKSFFALCFSLGVLPSLVLSSTLKQLSFSEVVSSAELIFEGSVISIEAGPGNGRMIYTYIKFQIHDVLKGGYGEESIELRFLGGEFEGRKLQVTDMLLPRQGETGFYFVESLKEGLVNPLVGWSQGHYVIHSDGGGVQRIMTADQRVIEALILNENDLINQQTGLNGVEISRGVARGVILRNSSQHGSQSLTEEFTAESFKASVLQSVRNRREPL